MHRIDSTIQAYPHTIIVRDDASWSLPNPDKQVFEGYNDLAYLREAQTNGWIKLIEGKSRIGHGCGLAALLDQTMTDLAMILDCDVQIKADGWLEDMVSQQEKAGNLRDRKTGAAMVANLEQFPDDNIHLQSWFFMLDMAQYPYIKDYWDYTRRKDGKVGWRGTGYLIQEHIWEQGRLIVPLPESVMPKWHHHCHISVLSAPQVGPEWEVRKKRYAIIQGELRRLRGSG